MKEVTWFAGIALFLSVFSQGTFAQNTNCSFQGTDYSLTWSVNVDRDVLFNLNYANFPTNGNYWVAFGYSPNNLIVVNTIDGIPNVQTSNLVGGQALYTIYSNILANTSASINENTLNAQFSIPLDALELSSELGTNCMTWEFFATPTQNGSTYAGQLQATTFCHIEPMCSEPNDLQGPWYGYYNANQRGSLFPYSKYLPETTNSVVLNTEKRQTVTNSNNFVVANPNLQFLPTGLQEVYWSHEFGPDVSGSANSGFQGGSSGYQSDYTGSSNGYTTGSGYYYPSTTTAAPFAYNNANSYSNVNGAYNNGDYSTGGGYSTPAYGSPSGVYNGQFNQNFDATTNAPVLSNDAQNQQNWQQIQANPPTTLPPSMYTNNIYGYDYRINQQGPFTNVGNNAQYQPPAYTKYVPPAGSPFAGNRKRQVASKAKRHLRNRRNSTFRKRRQSAVGANTNNQGPTIYTGIWANTAYADQANEFNRNSPANVFYSPPPVGGTPTFSAVTYNSNVNLGSAGSSAYARPYYSSATTSSNGFGVSDPTTNYFNDGGGSYTSNGQFPNGIHSWSEYVQTDPQSAIYYPFRTSFGYPAQPGAAGSQAQFDQSSGGFSSPSSSVSSYQSYSTNANDQSLQGVYQQNQAAQSAYQDPGCTGSDPYWCTDYTNNFMLWQNVFDRNNGNNQGQQASAPSTSACSALIDSLQNSYHRCCQNVQRVGCTSNQTSGK